MKKVIELRGVTKQFDGETVLDSIDLDIYDNEFLTLLGPSGCGKTTTLRMIGGFETPDQGDILFLGERINDIPPHKRNINTVFQRYALCFQLHDCTNFFSILLVYHCKGF